MIEVTEVILEVSEASWSDKLILKVAIFLLTEQS